MVESVLILSASSGKNLALANAFKETFTSRNLNADVVDLTELDWKRILMQFPIQIHCQI